MHTDTKENEADLVSEKTIERTYQRKLLRSQPLPLLLALLDHAPAVVGAAAPPHTELLRAFGTCIEALKPALQNGGQRLQGFNAESSIYNIRYHVNVNSTSAPHFQM